MSRAFFLFMLLIGLIIWLQQGEASPFRPDPIDLGTARYPAGAGLPGSEFDALTALHVWRENRHGADYRLIYAHGLEASLALEDAHDALGRRFRFRWDGGPSFRWQSPSACRGREWSCVYSEVLIQSEEDLEPIVRRIVEGFEAQSWTTTDAARWLLAFVQQIPYRLPTEHAFGLLPPALVASEDWGDCDSKSLLLIYLLERVGIEAILLTSEAHAHALVGIGVPTGASGAYPYRGREYAWAETTTVEAPLGWIHPSMRLPNDWRVVPVR